MHSATIHIITSREAYRLKVSLTQAHERVRRRWFGFSRIDFNSNCQEDLIVESFAALVVQRKIWQKCAETSFWVASIRFGAVQ